MQLTPEVKDVLKRCAVEANTLTLPEQLPRPLYVAVNKALECLGGKWNRKAKAHLFEDAAEDVINDAIATGAVVDFKKEFQFYETPDDLAARLVRIADVYPGMKVLEPSAGRGAIVRAIRAENVTPDVCELMPANQTVLLKMGVPIVGDDFLTFRGGPYDRVIANPPFTRGQDMLHVRHMLALLKHSGKVVSVMSPAWTFRQDKKSVLFREEMARRHAAWIELPPGSFKASGTNVNTGVLVVTL